MKRSTSLRIAGLAAAIGLIAALATVDSWQDQAAALEAADPVPVATNTSAAGRATLNVEVAEDGTRFVFDEDGPLLPNDFPAYGNGFVTQGYIYPAGTLTDSNGVNPDGSPEFPDDVIGSWTCWGYFVGEGADTTEGPWVTTTQVFEFDANIPGGRTIVTVGFETPAGAGPAVRAVTGGTGSYALARGEVTQVTLGHNISDGVNATFEFELRDVRPERPAKTVGFEFRDISAVPRIPH